jgi:hypothetical protein
MSSTIGDPYKPNLYPLWWYVDHTTNVGSARSLPNDPASCFANHTHSSDDEVKPRCYDPVQVGLPSTSQRTLLRTRWGGSGTQLTTSNETTYPIWAAH